MKKITYFLTIFSALFLVGCGEKAPLTSECFDKNLITGNDCPANFNPVCGCNGETYSNSCAAENSGVKKWENGKC